MQTARSDQDSPVVFRVFQLPIVRLLRDPRFARPFRVIALLLSVGYLVAVLGFGLKDLHSLAWGLYVRAIVVGLGLYPLSLIAQAVAWSLSLGALRQQPSVLDWGDIRIYAWSHLLKRLPGGFWYVAERVAAYREDGVHPSVPILASIVEWLLLLLTAGGAYLGFGLLAKGSDLIGALIAVFIAGVSGWAVGQAVTARGWLSGAPSPTRRSRSLLRGLTYFVAAELYLFAFGIGGVILMGFVTADGGTAFTGAQAITVWALVAGIGTVIGLLPAGVGVRDATLAVILTGYLSPPVAVIVAVLLRLLFVAGDLIWGSSLMIVARWLKTRAVRFTIASKTLT